MKYFRPGLHFFSAVNVDAHCVNGSIPGTEHMCTTGPEVSQGSCKTGGGATVNCDLGVGAHSTCSAVGTDIGLSCVGGGTP